MHAWNADSFVETWHCLLDETRFSRHLIMSKNGIYTLNLAKPLLKVMLIRLAMW